MDPRLPLWSAARCGKEFTRMNGRLLAFHLEGGPDMERTSTHFEQVPLEVVLAILEVEKERHLKPETPQISSEQAKSQPRTDRKS
jgi:hypothetical protein